MFGKREMAERNPFFAAGIEAARPAAVARRRISQHAVSLVVVAAAASFMAFALVPAPGPSLGFDSAIAAGKMDRLASASETDRACKGQVWGAENSGCLVAIAKLSGRAEATQIRLIASVN